MSTHQTVGVSGAPISRRRLLGSALAAGATASFLQNRPSRAADPAAASPAPQAVDRKIKLGVVGNGGRGAWIAGLFQNHGGYEIWGVADYFPEVAEACGHPLGVDRSRRFSTLSGYKRLIDSGIEAIALETPPCFFPEHAWAAVQAGVHVYMAKPVAVDVPGCLAIEHAAQVATENKRCFFVDYQMPTDPHNIEVMRRVHAGQVGPVAVINSHYFASTWPDPPFTDNLESRLRHLTWCNDVAIGGGHHVNACIHAIDAALWAAGGRPVAASGLSRRMRQDPHGDSHDTFAIQLEFADGQIVHHLGKHLNNQTGFASACEIHGQSGHAQITYDGRAFMESYEDACNGQVEQLYEAGAVRNIAAFYDDIINSRHENPTVRRSVDGALATILGREAARRCTRLTMDELIKEDERLDVDLRGLKS